jgi:hypothetical protein
MCQSRRLTTLWDFTACYRDRYMTLCRRFSLRIKRNCLTRVSVKVSHAEFEENLTASGPMPHHRRSFLLNLCLWMPEPVFKKIEMYIMTPEPISTAYLINPSHQSVSVCISVLSLQGNGAVNTFPRQWTHATIEELLDACLWVCVYPYCC